MSFQLFPNFLNNLSDMLSKKDKSPNIINWDLIKDEGDFKQVIFNQGEYKIVILKQKNLSDKYIYRLSIFPKSTKVISLSFSSFGYKLFNSEELLNKYLIYLQQEENLIKEYRKVAKNEK